jgi:hypothetical protein
MAIHAIIGRNAPQWMLALATTHEGDAEPSVYVADSGIYSESNMRQLNASRGEVGESRVGNVH